MRGLGKLAKAGIYTAEAFFCEHQASDVYSDSGSNRVFHSLPESQQLHSAASQRLHPHSHQHQVHQQRLQSSSSQFCLPLTVDRPVAVCLEEQAFQSF